MKPAALLLSSVLLVGSAPARIWTVDARGGGDFLDLPPAVAAAAPGDTLLVFEGVYTGTTLTRGLEIIGIRGATRAPSLQSPLVVNAVPSGERVLIRGLGGAFSGSMPPLTVRGCTGLVQVEDCGWSLFSFSGCSRPPAMLVEYCARVILHRCTIFGAGGCTSRSGGPALRLFGSTVHLYDCQVRGGFGAWCAGEFGGLALDARLSNVVMSRTHIEGGPGSSAHCLLQNCYQGFGGPGVDAGGSHFWQYGCTVLGGYTGEWQCMFPSPPTRSGVDWVASPARHWVDPEPLPSVRLGTSLRLGGTADLLIEPQSQRFQFVFASFGTGALEFPGLVGVLWLDPSQLFLIAVVAPGSSSFPPIPLENDPLAIGVDLHIQIVDAAGRFGSITSDVLR